MYIYVDAEKYSTGKAFNKWVGDTIYVEDVNNPNTFVAVYKSNITKLLKN